MFELACVFSYQQLTYSHSFTGMASMIHVGGTNNRNEYALSGDAFVDAFKAVAHARTLKGGVVMSTPGWNAIRGSVLRGKSFDQGSFAQVDPSYGVQGRKMVKSELTRHFLKLDPEVLEEIELEHSLSFYIPEPVSQCLSQHHDQHELWGNEVRFVSLMYVNTGISGKTIEGACRRKTASQLIHDTVLGKLRFSSFLSSSFFILSFIHPLTHSPHKNRNPIFPQKVRR